MISFNASSFVARFLLAGILGRFVPIDELYGIKSHLQKKKKSYNTINTILYKSSCTITYFPPKLAPKITPNRAHTIKHMKGDTGDIIGIRKFEFYRITDNNPKLGIKQSDTSNQL